MRLLKQPTLSPFILLYIYIHQQQLKLRTCVSCECTTVVNVRRIIKSTRICITDYTTYAKMHNEPRLEVYTIIIHREQVVNACQEKETVQADTHTYRKLYFCLVDNILDVLFHYISCVFFNNYWSHYERIII